MSDSADEIARLSAVLDSIHALHRPFTGSFSGCAECWSPYWPCPTHLLIHPEKEQ